MNLGLFIGVCDRKLNDCIIIEKPLNEIILAINGIEYGEDISESVFAPFVISIIPDIIPIKRLDEFCGFLEKIVNG